MSSPLKSFYSDRGRWPRQVAFGFASVAVTFGGLGVWSAHARLDAAVIANGNVEVESDRKAIQHLEGGVVQAILVANGDRVAKGDILLRVDPMQSKASASIARAQMLRALGDRARLTAEVDDAAAIAFAPDLASGGVAAADIVADEERQFLEARRSRSNQVAILGKRISEAQHQIEGATEQLGAARRQMASIDAEKIKIKPLIDKKLIVESRITALDRTRNDLEGRAGSYEADIARLQETIASTKLEIDGIGRKTAEDAGLKLSDANARLAEAQEKLGVQDDMVRRSELRAPRSGRVVNLKAHTVGAVVKPGETVMEIVPDDDRLVVTARLSPNDVAHVWPGLQAEVKLPSFHARTMPMAIGELTSVSADAMMDEARHEPYYEVKVSVQTTAFPKVIRDKLRPGMPAEVLIATGERTVLAYLVQPLADAMNRGMREN